MSSVESPGAAERTGTTAEEAALTRAEWQTILFARAPQRLQLLRLHSTWPTRRIRLRVHRNHAFEPVASVLSPYLAFAGLSAEVAFSEYDDSLTFATPGSADVELVWLDFARYRSSARGAELARWFVERLAALRATSAAPILVPDFAADSDEATSFNEELRVGTSALPAVYVCDQAAVLAELGPAAYFDSRASGATGTHLSNAACVATARLLGSRCIPAAVHPRLKAIVLDLDNTLYDGVLGEDGVGGVQLTERHDALQRRLVALGSEGLFLALSSRNEPADVTRLFTQRADFPLRIEHFSAVEIGWGEKAAALRRVANSLRIGTDSLLFLDDNPGELAAVAADLPDVKLLYAGPTPEQAVAALSFYPGLHRWRADETDALRAGDLGSARVRDDVAAQTSDRDSYLRSLDVRLRFARDPAGEIERLAALSNKTNQFNLSLRRLSLIEATQYANTRGRTAVSIRLADRLSDSGIIGSLFARFDGDTLLVDDLCISCRALGRHLEDIMVVEAIRSAVGEQPIRAIRFRPVEGPRNRPALDWLRRFVGDRAVPDAEGWITIAWDNAAAARLVADTPVTVYRDVA